MDSLTHVVLGGCLGQVVLGKKLGRKAIVWGAIADTIPDLDIFCNFFIHPVHGLLIHRGFTHSILFAFLDVYKRQNLPRIVTWAKFKWKGRARSFYVFNTHFDHQGVMARRQSARLLLTKVKEIAGDKNAIITGDFNATPSEEPIQIITDNRNPLHLSDTEHSSTSGHFGAYSSFNGFQAIEQEGRHIDYIFLNNPSIKVIRHGTLSHAMAGKYASDHHPVISVLKF